MEGFPQNKRESGVGRVIGVGDKEERRMIGVGSEEKKLLEVFEDIFREQGRGFADKEAPIELKELIDDINIKLKDFLARYGVGALMIPAENIHILDWSALTEEQTKQLKERKKDVSGMYTPEKQGICMLIDYKEGEKLKFTQALVHEMLHMNSFQSYEVSRNEEEKRGIELVRDVEGGKKETIRLKERRVGFRIFKNDKDVYFYDIDEAIIQELEMRFEREYFSQFAGIEEEYKRKRAILDRVTGDDADKKRERVARIETKKQEAGGWKATIVGYSYPDERETLNKLIDDLYEKNNEEFSSREKVFDVFVTAAMTGKMFEIGRLIIKTFGQGSFRELGEKTAKKE